MADRTLHHCFFACSIALAACGAEGGGATGRGSSGASSATGAASDDGTSGSVTTGSDTAGTTSGPGSSAGSATATDETGWETGRLDMGTDSKGEVDPRCAEGVAPLELEPTGYIYVSAEPATGIGDPSDSNGPEQTLAAARQAPMETLQAAVEVASPGTAIVVRGRTADDPLLYDGSVRFNAASSGSEDAPIWLVSETHRGARIVGSATSSAVEFSNAHDIQLHNFQIHNTSTGAEDDAPIKIVNDTGDGEIPRNAIVVAGNALFGSGRDGIKFGASRDVYFAGNRIDGGDAGFSQSAIDFVTGVHHEVCWNTIVGRFKEGVAMKGGTMDVVVDRNVIDIVGLGDTNAVGLLLGELGFSRSNRVMPFVGLEWMWAEMQESRITRNHVRTDFEHALWFRGATSLDVRENVFDATAGIGRMLAARSGRWMDQPVDPPAEHAAFVDYDGGADEFTYHNRAHTVVDNWVVPGMQTDLVMDDGEDAQHTLQPAAELPDRFPIEGPIGEAGWDASRIAVTLGIR